jgi:3-hydroxyisobutyrate dehydrogenase-like beta-hydroxyacid dehydrogenase
MPTIGILHPGDMGSVVGACAVAAGGRVLWASAGRSAGSRARAAAAGLEDAGTVDALVAASDVVVSVCPPHAALDLAREVAGRRFAGLFLDANAVAPATARAIGAAVEAGGATFVDGGLIGPPPRSAGSTRLYLSGREAKRAAALFEPSALEAIAIGDGAGAASALKMAYAAYTKGSSALLMAIRALAASEGVDDALLAEWRRSQPELPKRSESAARDNARKAWRFVGEMEEIAAAFEAAGLPGGFHEAAAVIYERLSGYKDAATPPTMADVVAPLTRPAKK